MSGEGDSLLRAVLEDPTDDGVRLVYADWLEENGEPERAEFIRLQLRVAAPWSSTSGECWQCHCARTEGQRTNGPCRCEPAWRELRRRLGLLVVNRGLEGGWPMPVPSVCNRYMLSRGFAGEIFCTWDVFDEHAAELFSAHPVVSVRLTDREPYESPGRTKRRWWWLRSLGRAVWAGSELAAPVFRKLPSLRPGVTAVDYTSWDKALEALSHACVALGRERAGLPPLPSPAAPQPLKV